VAIEVRPLSEADDRSRFESGEEHLDLFFRRYAGQNQFRHHIGAPYVAVDGAVIVGFATVTVGHIEIASLPSNLKKKLPDYPLPILRLARLAADKNAQGRSVGDCLLRAVFLIAIQLRENLGCVGVVVDAKPGAESYYRRFGFVDIEVLDGSIMARPAPTPMFLPLSALIQSLKSEKPRSKRRS
jgi:predicted N-acetyltransferase YhbS